MRILVTGGLGFIGSNFVRYLVTAKPDVDITIYDALTYSGRRENIKEVEDKVSVLINDIRDLDSLLKATKDVDVIYNFAAETHVDNSINNSLPFMETNFIGTYNVLESVRLNEVPNLVHISTSEVYGTALNEEMNEDHALNPQSPYAAAKAGADRLCYSYYKTYNTPVTIIRPFNNYGPRQFPEKLIPHFITEALQDKYLGIYGDGKYTRDWLYVMDHAEALAILLKKKFPGEVINLGTGLDTSVNDIANIILDKLRKPKELIRRIPDRPGHVRKHVSSTNKAEKLLGWKPKTPFKEGLKRTISWYKNNKWWWEPLVK
ncbi:MAG: dTDP-glucose 4,6-dehydratase [Candidatus Ranarchaeia archaeon]